MTWVKCCARNLNADLRHSGYRRCDILSRLAYRLPTGAASRLLLKRTLRIRIAERAGMIMRRPNSLEQELQGFSSRILSLVESGQPVKIQVGFGWTPEPGFVNLDIGPLLGEGDNRSRSSRKRASSAACSG